jgi:hypothetical protein
MGSLALIVVVVAVVVGVVGFLVVRARQPAPPPNANENRHVDAAWDSDGAVPKEADGTPLQSPGEAPSHSDAIQEQAQREAGRGPGQD